MSKVTMTEVSVERCLLDMPNEILFEIFRRIPKGKLIELSKLCLRFRSVAGDSRVWKNLCVKYEQNYNPYLEIYNSYMKVLQSKWKPITMSQFKNYAFEELYSEPWPVKLVDLSKTKINPPVSSQTDQAVKVNKLVLSVFRLDKVTVEAILDRYQCTELYLENELIYDVIEKITPEAFSKQIALETLSMRSLITWVRLDGPAENEWHSWLAQALNNCKNLKTLNFSYTYWSNSDMLRLVKNLPTSLEKLLIGGTYPEDSFFESLAESIPNLKELQLYFSALKCPSLLNFQFLEVLQLIPDNYPDVFKHLIRFPALKTVYLNCDPAFEKDHADSLEKFRTALEPHGINVRPINVLANVYPPDGTFTLWNVSKAMM